jgi:hypothetical protein
MGDRVAEHVKVESGYEESFVWHWVRRFAIYQFLV